MRSTQRLWQQHGRVQGDALLQRRQEAGMRLELKLKDLLMRYLLSCGLYSNWLGAMVDVHSDLRRRHALARPHLHGRVVQRSAVQSDQRVGHLQYARLSDQLCGVAVV